MNEREIEHRLTNIDAVAAFGLLTLIQVNRKMK